MGDNWLTDYDACSRMGQDIMEKINQRNRQPKGTSGYSKETAHIRAKMRQFSLDLTAVRESLIQSATQRRVTQRELDRRQVLLDELITKEKQLERAFKNEDISGFGPRSALYGDSSPFARDSGYPQPPDNGSTGSSPLSVDQIRQHQSQMISQQDEGLDVLSDVLGRQKQMAMDIGNEVEYHNELIDDIGDHVDRTDQRLIRETRHIRVIDRKSGSCAMWVVIVLLLVAIVIIAVIPYNGKP